MHRRVLSWTLAVTAGLAWGCSREDTKTKAVVLTPEQEAAVKEYVSLLEEKVELEERTAAVLATVQVDGASRAAALTKLVKIADDLNALNSRMAERRPTDMAVLLEGQERILARQMKAVEAYKAEVSRIVKMPGGEDFFTKQLQPLLEKTK